DRAEGPDAAPADVETSLAQASAALDRALGGAPSPDALYLAALARTLDDREGDEEMRSAEAEALLRRALARDPDHARAHVLLGQVLAKRGGDLAAEAEREVRRAERVSPEHRDVLDLVGNYAAYRAVETGDARYVEWAVDVFRSLHRLEPE